jgi:ferredoxin-type protein NapG
VAGPPDHSNRRRFFAEGLARLTGPLADYLDARLDLPTPRTRLRPPGAIPEDEFNDTCYRCGTCVELCPVDAIVTLHDPEQAAHGTPVIDPDLAACTLCEERWCMENCPSGALQKVRDVHAIRMGLALVYGAVCVRTTGQDCTQCVDACPLGAQAIRLTGDGPPEVRDPGCVGCGQCQMHCPTMPKAIRVKPL